VRTADRLVDVRDHAVRPTPRLVSQRTQSAGAPRSDGALRDDAAPGSVRVRDRPCLLDHVAGSVEGDDERRVVQVTRRAPVAPRGDRLVERAVHTNEPAPGAQRQPVQVDGTGHRAPNLAACVRARIGRDADSPPRSSPHVVSLRCCDRERRHVHVTVTTADTTGEPIENAPIVAEEMERWLREMEGFEGFLMLAGDHKAIGFSFWDSRERAEHYQLARAQFRERMLSIAGVQIESIEDYDVVFARLGAGFVDAAEG
jgi:heme-degrading monooxygenase HmoA